jgi:hypothetical protein
MMRSDLVTLQHRVWKRELENMTSCGSVTHTNIWSKTYVVADHLVQSFIIRFAGASYRWYVNVHSGIVGDWLEG